MNNFLTNYWYYDEQGNFHVERRLGCIGCPLRSDNGKSDFVKYPKFLKRLIASTQTFIDTHPQSSSVRKFGNAYNVVFHNLFTNSYAKYQNLVTGGMFPETAIDAKAFMEDYIKIDLTIWILDNSLKRLPLCVRLKKTISAHGRMMLCVNPRLLKPKLTAR